MSSSREEYKTLKRNYDYLSARVKLTKFGQPTSFEAPVMFRLI